MLDRPNVYDFSKVETIMKGTYLQECATRAHCETRDKIIQRIKDAILKSDEFKGMGRITVQGYGSC